PAAVGGAVAVGETRGVDPRGQLLGMRQGRRGRLRRGGEQRQQGDGQPGTAGHGSSTPPANTPGGPARVGKRGGAAYGSDRACRGNHPMPTPTLPPERRVVIRELCGPDTTCRLRAAASGGTLWARVQDASPDGLGLLLARPLAPGSFLAVELRAPGVRYPLVL